MKKSDLSPQAQQLRKIILELPQLDKSMERNDLWNKTND